ncbi:hypothetical protein AAFF_G00129730 [Aldrovandia affinis]|uniref:Uncharacterized protein n=1 Tax=Aldrovandia affinis TaxID=143900 RepID=A0AAD7W9U0_9TELE|nr:hypothetical protein AAFF_G00129730 [Aldrovandia affinis]
MGSAARPLALSPKTPGHHVTPTGRNVLEKLATEPGRKKGASGRGDRGLLTLLSHTDADDGLGHFQRSQGVPGSKTRATTTQTRAKNRKVIHGLHHKFLSSCRSRAAARLNNTRGEAAVLMTGDGGRQPRAFERHARRQSCDRYHLAFWPIIAPGILPGRKP